MKDLSDKNALKNVPKGFERILYTCKKCGWKVSISAVWSDIKPKMCMNKKCDRNRTNAFLKYKEDLLVESLSHSSEDSSFKKFRAKKQSKKSESKKDPTE